MSDPKGPVIWIVEDDPSVQRVIAQGLKAHGFQSVIFGTAEKAYGALGYRALPDLVILDMLLPGMSGVDLIRLLKQNKVWQKIPVVVVSVLSRNELEKGEDSDAKPTLWVNKPFETNALMRTIQDILSAVH
jgi:DNA-binding response OmpR family regulator